MRGLAGDAWRYGWVSVPLAALWILAAMRLFVDPTPRIPLLFNWSPSLPYRVAWLSGPAHSYARGDYVVFRFEGEAQYAYPGLRHQPFFKIIAGVAGDAVTVRDRNVFVGGDYVGFAKLHSFDGRALEPIAQGRIPAGTYFMRGTSSDSFDSRYRASGLVSVSQIRGRVIPLF
jgi:conjugal transfer pilin signal peptidase TrbI